MQHIIGLKAITIGDIAVDGGMGTVLTEIFGETVKGSASLTSTEPTLENVETEEFATPIEVLVTAEATFALKASSYNISPATLQLLLGGTITGTAPNQTWKAPLGGSTPIVEKSVIVESKTGIRFKFVKMKLTAAMNIAFDKTRLGQIDWTGTLLTPDKVGTEPWVVEFGTAGDA